MADTDILVSEMTPASQINTTDLMIMTQPDAQAETGYSTKSGTVLQVANKILKGTEYSTDLPDFTDKTPLGGLEELKADIKALLPISSASGNPCTFETNLADNLVSLIANITASGGGGTPATPIPIVGHSELNLVRCGKNLFNNDVTAYQCSYTSGTMTNTGTDTRTEFYPTVRWYKNGAFINANSGAAISATGRYSLIVNNGLEQCDKIVFGHNGANLDINVSIPINLDNTRAIISFTVDGYNPSTVGGLVVKDIQLELGTTESTFEQYNGETFTVQFGQTVYGGVYDANRGKVRITYARVNMGDLTYWDNGSIEGGHQFATNITDKAIGTLNILSSMFEALYPSNAIGKMAGRDNNTIVSFNSAEATIAAFKTSVAGQDLAYELATPIEIDVSELSVDTIVGVNNIISDCNGDVEVQYRDSIQHYIDSKIASVQALIL